MHRGYIKLYRKIQDNFLWSEPREFSKAEAWIDILMEVNHKDGGAILGGGMSVTECKAGQSLKSLDTWANRWRWSNSKVRRFFKMLTKAGMIRTENVSKTTRLTVCNYEDYTEQRRDNDGEATGERRGSDGRPTANKNDKNGKHENNEKKEEGAKAPRKSKKFVKPTVHQVRDYADKIGYTELDPEAFIDFYGATGWRRGSGTPIKDWQACVRTWKKRDQPDGEAKKPTDWTDQKTRTLYSVQGRIPEEHRALFDADFADPEYRAMYADREYPIPPEYVPSFNGNGKPSADLFDADERETV